MRRALVVLLFALSSVLATLVGIGAQVATAPPVAAYPLEDGYWTAASDGGIFVFGGAQFFGSTGDIKLNRPIVGMAATPFLEGYWLVATDGGLFSFGSAGFFGSTGNINLNKPIVGMAPTPSGLGYWLVASDGGIFAFGDAEFFGSTGNINLNKPIVGMTAAPDGKGYWLVATDGGIFAFGTGSQFFGSTGDIKLNKPIVGMAATKSGGGYYMVASDGGIFAFGNALFLGSAGDINLNAPIVGMDLSRSGNGYQFVATDGGIFNYGDSAFHGSTGDIRLNKPMLGMAVRPALGVKVDAFPSDSTESSSWTASGGDYQLALTKTLAGGTPAGARVYGVEGLTVAQLQTLGFDLVSGPCDDSAAMFGLFWDADHDGAADGSAKFTCNNGGGAGATKTFDPTTLAPATATVTALDVWNLSPVSGTSVVLDNIVVAGLRVTDYTVVRAA